MGFEDDHATLWQIFSHAAKRHLTLELNGERTNESALYNFHESLVDALRPMLKEGIRSVVVTAPTKTTYTADFLSHVRKHHQYMIHSRGSNRVSFAELTGSADQPNMVAELVKTKECRRIIAETTSEEAEQIVDTLEKHLFGTNGGSAVLFSLKEIEDHVYDRERKNDLRGECLVLTDKYLSDSENKGRIQRLLQISKNQRVSTRIVNAETPAGKRISQFGGMALFTIPTR